MVEVSATASIGQLGTSQIRCEGRGRALAAAARGGTGLGGGGFRKRRLKTQTRGIGQGGDQNVAVHNSRHFFTRFGHEGRAHEDGPRHRVSASAGWAGAASAEAGPLVGPETAASPGIRAGCACAANLRALSPGPWPPSAHRMAMTSRSVSASRPSRSSSMAVSPAMLTPARGCCQAAVRPRAARAEDLADGLPPERPMARHLERRIALHLQRRAGLLRSCSLACLCSQVLRLFCLALRLARSPRCWPHVAEARTPLPSGNLAFLDGSRSAAIL
ncbi:hypothetical protein GGR56DRAFT_644420 [Xylariaceae sp. FL0804]|nr:hypothetical protein GGR56DRAFT_644420 [Xylariaceae sp. FL0804]